MPIKNAIQVIEELRKFFDFTKQNEEETELVEPTYIILTAYATPQFKAHLKNLKI